ncbi:hypothetical protein D3C78_1005160 [compost metagenome]
MIKQRIHRRHDEQQRQHIKQLKGKSSPSLQHDGIDNGANEGNRLKDRMHEQHTEQKYHNKIGEIDDWMKGGKAIPHLGSAPAADEYPPMSLPKSQVYSHSMTSPSWSIYRLLP